MVHLLDIGYTMRRCQKDDTIRATGKESKILHVAWLADEVG